MTDNAASRASRLLDLVPFILNHPGISIRELADEFSISKDEMIKDLNLLFMCGLPGYTPLELIDISFDDDSVVVRDPQNLSAPRRLTESESLIARIALAAVEELTPVNSSSRTRIATIRGKLASAFNSSIPESALLVTVDEERIALAKAKEAIEKSMDIEMTYNNRATDEITRRRVSPSVIRIDHDKTLLEGFCHKAQAQRTFNFVQISQVELVERLDELSGESNSQSEGSVAVLLVSDDKSDFVRTNFSSLRSTDKGRYEIAIYQPEWLVRSVLSNPDLIKLEAPSALRERITVNAQIALENYRR